MTKLLPIIVALLLVACTATAAPTVYSPFTLVDVATGKTYSFSNGGTLHYGAKYFVRVKANAQTQSVRFRLDSNPSEMPQNSAPYDSAKMSPSLGKHVLAATPWSKDNGKGTIGPTVRVYFSVVKPSPTPLPTASPTASPTVTPRPSPSNTPSPSPSPTASQIPTPTPSPTPPLPTPSPSTTVSPSPFPTITPTPAQVQVTVSWTATAGDSYKLYYGTEKGNYLFAIDAGTSGNYVLTGLSPNQTYYFALTAIRNTAESPKSQEVSYTATAALKQKFKLPLKL